MNMERLITPPFFKEGLGKIFLLDEETLDQEYLFLAYSNINSPIKRTPFSTAITGNGFFFTKC